MATINTVCGPIPADRLGRTLMHEHLVSGMAGWEQDTLAPGPSRRALVALCIDRVEELKANGYQSMVDPCPNDLGRDLDLMREVSARTSFHIIAATGFYNETFGGNAYWRMKAMLFPDFVDRLSDLMIHELTDGHDGVKPGVIKLATGAAPMTTYEHKVFEAGARASIATGTPITTHTEGVFGDQQLALLKSLGVPAHRVLIGHCCESNDFDYLDALIDEGCYVGFDRFGYESICSDDQRIESFLRVWHRGACSQTVLSHDSVWCLRGEMLPKHFVEQMAATSHPMHINRVILPRLKAAGLSVADIDHLFIDNPRRYFETAGAK